MRLLLLLLLTPGHLEAVGQNPPSDHGPAGTARFVRICDELDHLARVTLPLRVVRCHLESIHEPQAERVTLFMPELWPTVCPVDDGERVKVSVFPDNEQRPGSTPNLWEKL